MRNRQPLNDNIDNSLFTDELASRPDQDRLGVVPLRAREGEARELGVSDGNLVLPPVAVLLVVEEGAHAPRHRLARAGARAEDAGVGDAMTEEGGV